VTWNPPLLTPEQELEFGRQIALVGREHFVRDFRNSIGKTKPPQEKAGIAAWPPIVRWAFVIVVGAFLLFGLTLMTDRDWSRLFAYLIFIVGVYLVSVYLATRKFEKWIDGLVAKYAAHVARGGN